MKLQSMLLGKSLHFLFSRLGWWGIIFLAVLCFDPETMGKMMAHSGIEDSSSSGAEKGHETTAASTSKEKYASDVAKGKRPLSISQEEVWKDVDRIKQQQNIIIDSDWTANWVTTRENALGDMINELRKEERMRPLGPYRLQEVVESLENKYSIERLDEIIRNVKEKRLDSSFYQESKIDRDLPKEAALKAAIRDVTKGNNL